MPDDHVFLQAAQVIDVARDRGIRQNARGFLETCRRNETVGRQGCARDAQKNRLGLRRRFFLLFSFFREDRVTAGAFYKLSYLIRCLFENQVRNKKITFAAIPKNIIFGI